MRENKSEDHFGFSNFFIKKTVHFDISLLSNVMNRFIIEGCSSTVLKIAKVIPVHQKRKLKRSQQLSSSSFGACLIKNSRKSSGSLAVNSARREQFDYRLTVRLQRRL